MIGALIIFGSVYGALALVIAFAFAVGEWEARRRSLADPLERMWRLPAAEVRDFGQEQR